MAQEQKLSLDAHRVIHGRPRERTLERVAFNSWVKEFCRENPVSPATSVWFENRFLDELDRRRGLERAWRRLFWSTRYVILSGSLVLPVLITAGRAIIQLNFVAIIVSITVALATALEALLRSGRKWRLYRQGGDKISSEGVAFFQMLGAYAQPDPLERLHIFKENVEETIKDLHESYLADIEVAASQNVIASSSDRLS